MTRPMSRITRFSPRSRDQAEPHDFYSGAELSYDLSPYSAMMLLGKLRQEVHHGHCRPADSSRGTCTVGLGGLTASGSRHGYRPPSPTPPCPCALVWAGRGSLGARDS